MTRTRDPRLLRLALQRSWDDHQQTLVKTGGKTAEADGVTPKIVESLAATCILAGSLGDRTAQQIETRAWTTTDREARAGLFGPVGLFVLREVVSWLAWRLAQHYLADEPHETGHNGEPLCLTEES